MFPEKTKISLVSYINTWPFLYGIQNYTPAKEIFEPILDYPAECARKIISGQVNIGLLPVGGLLQLKDYEIITPFCIGAENNVYTVALYSNSPLKKVKTVFLDYQSTTSVILTQIIFKIFRKQKIVYTKSTPEIEQLPLSKKSAILIIGDRCFDAYKKYPFTIDLSTEWNKFTGLPFAFAVWVSTKQIAQNKIDTLTKAFAFGLEHLNETVKEFNHTKLVNAEILNYLSNNIQYDLNENRISSINKFLEYAKLV